METHQNHTRPSPLSSLLEVQALRKLEALQRWMEATDTRPEMQRLLSDAIEDLRDAAMRAVADVQASGVSVPVSQRVEPCPAVEPYATPDSEELLFDEGPRAQAHQELEPARQTFTFQVRLEQPEALWQEGFTPSSAPLPVLVDEPEFLRKRAHPPVPRPPRPRASLHARMRETEVLELSASESGEIESARFVSIQGLEPGECIGGSAELEEAWVEGSPGDGEMPRPKRSAGRLPQSPVVSFWFGGG